MPPSPPAKATAREDQTGKASTGNGAGHQLASDFTTGKIHCVLRMRRLLPSDSLCPALLRGFADSIGNRKCVCKRQPRAHVLALAPYLQRHAFGIGAIHAQLVCAEFVQAVNADLNRLGVVVGDIVDVFGVAQ
jgi:hypothetical protein